MFHTLMNFKSGTKGTINCCRKISNNSLTMVLCVLALFGSEHIYLYIMFILKLDQFVMLLSYETVYRYMRCDCKNRCMRCY